MATVVVARYEHKHGADTRVFRTSEAAGAWRREIAEEYYEQEIGEPIPDGMTPGDVSERYWESVSEREWFETEEVNVEG